MNISDVLEVLKALASALADLGREAPTNCFRAARLRGEADTGEGEEGAVYLRRRSLSP